MNMQATPGQIAPIAMLPDIPKLIDAYYSYHPAPDIKHQLVSFGTSGHRGSSLTNTFNQDHIRAIMQAIVYYRQQQAINGPLFLAMDTHALSQPAHTTALEVLAANGVEVMMQQDGGYTPTPAASHAILSWNRTHQDALADGVIITPSHNPPEDGGIKYNPPNGGPADTDVTSWIANKANELLKNANTAVKSLSIKQALSSGHIHQHDFVMPYVEGLKNIIDMDKIAQSGINICADSLGGAGFAYYEKIAEFYKLKMSFRNNYCDPTFRFMTLDHDKKIRMDCSSPYAMTSLVELKNDYDIAFGNDTDFDRHGIVTPTHGLLNPNHYLAVAIDWLFNTRKLWSSDMAVGKTLVSSSIIDRVVAGIGRNLYEVPVGFKWFVAPMANSTLGFGGEESAGASFLQKDAMPWSTDKDGIIMNLLAAEITAVSGQDPAQHYQTLIKKYGEPIYARIDAPANKAQKELLEKLSPQDVTATELAGEKITARMTAAPSNNQPLNGLKVTTDNGWFAARPSGTEDIYKIYAESFVDEKHLKQIQDEAVAIIADIFKKNNA